MAVTQTATFLFTDLVGEVADVVAAAAERRTAAAMHTAREHGDAGLLRDAT